ncbi:hypothetical protein [Microbacterium sp.]|uniref:hypothetical protein n=1 Tax=Microbacterium sp. TaxID=51671 RepID=UPI003A8FA7DD
MPVLSNEIVNVTPVTCTTDMSLEQIRDALAELPPDLPTYTGGWASANNEESNLSLPNAIPPSSEPELLEADGWLPKRILARYYYWSPVAQAVSHVDPDGGEIRILHALDVLVTEASVGQVSIVVSSRNHSLVRRRDGAIRSLERLFRSQDDRIRADFSSSAFALEDTDIFLWLAVKVYESPQLDAQIHLDSLSGISGTDASRRTADLRMGVDFQRPNFLTAVAEADTLGPIELKFSRHTAEGRSDFQLRLHVDGGFQISKTGIKFPAFQSTPAMMLRASHELLFDLIPRINDLYTRDAAWPTKRTQVIAGAMTDLSERYQSLLELLNERLTQSPGSELEED